MKTQFSITNLLLFSALVALGLAWSIDHWQAAQEIRVLERQLEASQNQTDIQSFFIQQAWAGQSPKEFFTPEFAPDQTEF